jgi:uncharacterized protein (DUF736 family)
MATIGSFVRKPDGTYEGSLATLTMQVRLRLVPLEEKTSDKAPDFRVYAGRAELGAAWSRETPEGLPYLSVTLDDPSFAAPITAALFRTEGDADRHVLVWNRPRRE